MKSVWSDLTDFPVFETLNRNIKTDVLIIGGGMAGILCAYMLEKAGVDYVLLEATRIGNGVTKNTTAKITSQHGLIYDQLIKDFGIDKAKMYLNANQAAVEKFREICKNIDCDFENKDAFVYSLDNHKKIIKEKKALDKLGFDAEYLKNISLPFPVCGAIKFKNQAQFNPLKFISAISAKLNIFENSAVRELSEHKATTDNAVITANKIITTTHFPFINKHGNYFIKMYQHRSYVIALENAEDVNGMYVDEADNGMSFRNYKNLLLIGGGDHRTGKKGGNWSELEEFANRYYPDAVEKYRWATQDCMTLDRIPYIGLYSKNTPDFYVATGFNKWGMTSSMVAATILSDMVCGRKSEYEQVFLPTRTILRAQLAVNSFEAVKNLLTISKKRCPHLGCALKWNDQEHSWDCPCHGSRFTEDGKLIDNPATGNLKK
ncbi:MAG: FAD-dependent oxidoreductase [Clostridiales bacterium]|nr:MAG: FAD-dependent oxidoreductase [Clostridiales bacterium]